MARYICPSCGASYNGKKCRQCCYEHFSEEISHGSHTHRGEPLVIDSPVRRPIPQKDPFGCPPKKKENRKRKKRPMLGFLLLLFLINAVLPLARDFGLELEAREALVSPEPVLPEQRVILHQEASVTISTLPDCLTDFPNGVKIFVENQQKNNDIYVCAKYVMVNGFVLPESYLYVEAAGGAYGMDTLYIYDDQLASAYLTQVQELTFVLEAVDEDYNVLFQTDPITFTLTGRPVEQPVIGGGETLIDEDGLLLQYLGHRMDPDYPGYENGQLRFYAENNTDSFLSLSSLDVKVGGEAVDLFLWAELPAGSRAVVEMELWGLEELDFTSPKELGDLTMTVEFWDQDSDSVRGSTLTIPMAKEEPVTIS